MSDISPHLHDEVMLRAGYRCEYCRLSQLGQEATFHIDHVVPRAAGGPTTSDNLALSCVSCSLPSPGPKNGHGGTTARPVAMASLGRTMNPVSCIR